MERVQATRIDLKSMVSNDHYPVNLSSNMRSSRIPHIAREREMSIIPKIYSNKRKLTKRIPGRSRSTIYRSGDLRNASRLGWQVFKPSAPLSFPLAADILEPYVLSNDTRWLYTKTTVKQVSRNRIAKTHDVPRYIATRDTRLPAQVRYYLAAIKLTVTVTFVGSYFLRLSSLDNTVSRRGDPNTIRGKHATDVHVHLHSMNIKNFFLYSDY